MPKTYYDSELSAVEIESVLEAIHDVVSPSNNGKILGIESGRFVAKSASEYSGDAVLEPLNVTANGDYYPRSGTDGFDEVHVSVPGATLITKNITQNGTYNASSDNADGYSSVTVNVSGGGGAVVQPLSVTQNGTYNPPSGVDGYAPVTVNVSGGGSGVITGTTDPTASQGNNGDVYLKIASSTLDRLEYIENTSNAWIQTEYVPKNSSKFELDGIFPAPSNSYDTPFGTRGYSDNFVAYNGGTYRYVFGNGSGNVGNMASYYDQDATMVLSALGCSLVVNGVAVLESSFSASGVSNVGMGLFTLATGSTSRIGACDAKFKLKEFRIYEDNILVHQYVPSINNNIVGLTDIIESIFRGPASGGGNFVSGPQQGEMTFTTVANVYYKVNGVWKQIPGGV